MVLLGRKCGACGTPIQLGTRCVPQPDGLNWQVFSSCHCGIEIEGWAKGGELEALLAEVRQNYLGRGPRDVRPFV